MDPEGRAVKIRSGKRSAACEEWMRNRRICGKLTIDTAVFIYKMLGQKSLTMIRDDEVNYCTEFCLRLQKMWRNMTHNFLQWGKVYEKKLVFFG